MPAHAPPSAPHSGVTLIDAVARATFRDGTQLELQQVTRHNAPARRLRAMRTAQGLRVVDVSKLDRELASDLCRLPDADADGLITYTLRQQYGTAEAAQRALAAHTITTLSED